MSIPTLINVRVDPTLFNRYAAEFNAFDAIAGNTVTVVPEPSAIFLCTAAWILGWAFPKSLKGIEWITNYVSTFEPCETQH